METKRVAIEQLSGAALDWAVAKASGVDVSLTMAYPSNGRPGLVPWDDDARKPYKPTMDWRQCGPLKASYKVDATYMTDGSVRCRCPKKFGGLPTFEEGFGWDELTAACRAIVAANNPSGYVEVPADLLEPK